MKVYRLFFGDLAARMGWQLAPLLGLMTFVGLSEGLTMVLLLPLLTRIGVMPTSSQDSVQQLLESGFALLGAVSLTQILAIIIAVALIQTISAIGLNWWMVRLARRYQRERQLELFRSVISARWNFVLERKAGELTSAIVIECERIGTAFVMALSAISTFVITIVYLALSIAVAWQVFLCIAAFATFTALLLMRLYKLSYAVGSAVAPLNADLQTEVIEQFSAFKLIKATASEDRAVARIGPILKQIERQFVLLGFLPAVVRIVLELIAFAGLAIIIVLASRGIGVAIGNVMIVIAMFARLFPRLTALQANLHYLNGYVPAAEAVAVLQAAAIDEAEPLNVSPAPLQIQTPVYLRLRSLDVELGGRKVLDHVDFDIPVPGLTGLVGASGEGKSTLIHCLLGLVEHQAGSICLGPHDMAATPLQNWRQAFGYVPQETILFHASIKDNLTLSNASASDGEIETALRRAHAFDFVTALPRGLDTIIGDQGAKLSGGQRQRLGIARALLTGPAMLLMDEAMSALDAESEREVLRAIEELRRTMGIVLIAHRLQALQNADVICVLKQGSVAEIGNWDALMSKRGRLFELSAAHSFTKHEGVSLER